MEYRLFGRTGVRVSTLTLGAMNFGSRAKVDATSARQIIDRALDAGINTIDTADVYSRGESESIVGTALAGRREDIFLASKFNGPIGDGLNTRGNSRRWIHLAVENSLRRLGTDWIDLYQVHRPEHFTDIDETLGALSDLVRAGKIRYIGTSTFGADAIVEAQWTAERRGRERPVSEQPPYSLLARAAESDVLPAAERYGIAVLPWSPLAGGYLSGRYRPNAPPPESLRRHINPGRHDLELPANRRKVELVHQLSELADASGIALAHLAIAFVLRHPATTSVIIGPRTLEHLEGVLSATELRLSTDILDSIDQIVPPGTTVNDADRGYLPPALTDPSLRRRP